MDRFELIATTICKSGRFETGEGTCALLCLSVLGDARRAPCPHAKEVHGKLARDICVALKLEA